jgi:hypothetical protein
VNWVYLLSPVGVCDESFWAVARGSETSMGPNG